MQDFIQAPPPPPPQAREAILPPPRAALQDASDRINHSPTRLAPIGNTKGVASQEGLTQVLNGVENIRTASQIPAASSHENAGVIALMLAAGKLGAPAVKDNQTSTKPVAGSASKKRKAGPETSLAEDIAAYKQDLDIDVDDMYVDMNCSQVRTRINQVLDGGIMNKGQFCKTIGSSNRSLNTFLQKRGMDGANTDSYANAWAWFKQRELVGLKMPDVKKRQKAEAAATTASGLTTSSDGPASKKARSSGASPDLSHVHLDGEETDSVPVFDTADEIRKKISAHLKTPGLTQAQFCRDLYTQLKAPTCKGIQPKQLSDFRGQKGPLAGCSSAVFYAAYVYFEKLRVAKGKPKSAHRTNMEEIHAGKGLDRDRDGRRSYWTAPGESAYMDQYGQVTFS